jgi:hypothetical protein
MGMCGVVCVSQEIEEKLFAHARRRLTLWKKEHERMYGEGSWEKAEMPPPDNIGLHRLSENAVLMSDTCNAARATKRLLAEMAEAAGRERIGTEAWSSMTEEEQQRKVKCHLGDCHDHLRNIIIKAMAGEATTFLKDRLEDSLDEFSSFDRMSVDGMDLIRAACKELHPNGEYAKGKGREMMATRVRDHASKLWLPIFNASGTCMDAAFDGAVPLYMDRAIILELLHPLVNGPASKDNLLEKFLWRVLSCTEMVGLLRVCTLFQTLLTEPLRWLTGKGSKVLNDWSMNNSNELLDETYELMVAIAADGGKLLDPTLDPFASVAAKQPKFAEHRRAQRRQTVKAPDDSVWYLSHVRTLHEARSPTDEGDQESTPIAKELASRMANAALVAMRDAKRAIADKLSSQEGVNAVSSAKAARVHEATKGAHVMNAHVESNFGAADNATRTWKRKRKARRARPQPERWLLLVGQGPTSPTSCAARSSRPCARSLRVHVWRGERRSLHTMRPSWRGARSGLSQRSTPPSTTTRTGRSCSSRGVGRSERQPSIYGSRRCGARRQGQVGGREARVPAPPD